MRRPCRWRRRRYGALRRRSEAPRRWAGRRCRFRGSRGRGDGARGAATIGVNPERTPGTCGYRRIRSGSRGATILVWTRPV
jgi:hypothetical protein